MFKILPIVLFKIFGIIGPSELVPETDLSLEAVRLIGYPKPADGEVQIFCTGTFITEEWMITAAHCVFPQYDSKELFDWASQTKATHIYSYDHTPFGAREFDMALVRFPKGTFKGKPISISAEIPKAKDQGLFVGFGKTNLDQKEIDQKKRMGKWTVSEDSDSNLFVLGKSFFGDSDSGGPFLVRNKKNEWEVAAIANGVGVEKNAEGEMLGFSTFTRIYDLKNPEGRISKAKFLEETLK